MRTVAIAMVRDEADVIEGTLRHMADEVDHLIVADNLSTDGTRDLLDSLAKDLPLTVVDDPDPGYTQSAKMSALAERASIEQRAGWIVPFDADELWVARDRIKTVLADNSQHVAAVNLYNHFPSAVDPEGSDPFRTIVWRQRDPAPLPKVAFRYEPGALILQGNHGVRLPSGAKAPHSGQLLEVRHFPYRSAEQFVRKARNGAAAYRATNLPETEGAHWRSYGDLLDRLGEGALEAVFREHFWFLSPVDSGMVLDPAPYLRWK